MFLEKKGDIERSRILREPELFRKKLRLVLGERDAGLTELLIVQRLASSFELKNDRFDLTLVEAIGLIRASRGEAYAKVVQGIGR